MKLENIVAKTVTSIRKATLDYEPSFQTADQNKTKAIVGSAVLLGLYIIPGSQALISYPTFLYTAVKGYQAVRDWAGK